MCAITLLTILKQAPFNWFCR